MSRPTVVMYGVGAMGTLITRMLRDKGVEIVGGVCRSPSKQGTDLGELAGMAPLGVPVTVDAKAVLKETRPDLVIMTIASYMHDVYGPMRLALESGCNVISLSEEMLCSWLTSPEETASLDAIARAHGVTLMCSGHQDGYWVSLVSTLLGTAFHVDEVRGRATWNVDDFGPELARDQYVGKSLSEFEAWAATADRPPTFGRTSLHALARAAGLTVSSSTTTSTPVVADTEVHCAALNILVKPGELLGFTDIDTVTTNEGPLLALEMTGKVYTEGENDSNRWDVAGEPALSLSNERLQSHLTTCATLVNRIPDVLNAPPGYLTIDELPRLRYRPRDLGEYLNP